jgi:hypothetical protein
VGSELERVQVEAARLAGRDGRLDNSRGGGNQRVRAVQEEVAARIAVINGAHVLARVADQVDGELAVAIQDGVLRRTSQMEENKKQYEGPLMRGVGQRASQLFSERHLLHSTAYYYAFGEQATRQVVEELSAPEPRRRRRLFGLGEEI